MTDAARTPDAIGIGLATIASDGTVLDTFYPDPLLLAGGPVPADLEARISRTTRELEASARPRDVRTFRVAATQIASLAAPPLDTADAYLRLHLLSSRQVLPNSINLEGIFAVLPNTVWTNTGAVHPDDFPRVRLMMNRRALTVHSVDRLPRMTDYVIPDGVRIADASRVRLGAYLAAGTVVMPEGFCNFNAGTLGVSMVEGRISQGVVVGDGSDIGGGASIMGTLSGGGTVRVSIGKRCLIGANAGVGISLGDDCIIESGLYVTAGTKVALYDTAGGAGGGGAGGGGGGAEGGGAGGGRVVIAARDLAGRSGLLFRRHSLTGEVQAVPVPGRWQGLNAALHHR